MMDISRYHFENSTKKTLLFNGLLRFPITFIYCVMGLVIGTLAITQTEFMQAIPADKPDLMIPIFIREYLPNGLIGILMVAIFSAAMSSTSSELNALGSTTTIDFYKRRVKQDGDDDHYLKYSKLFTLGWGILAIIVASTLSLFDNLIEAVNLIGSLFYPTVLGIFIVAFFFKKIRSNAVFIGAILSQAVIILIHYLNTQDAAGIFTMGFLWYNALGCILVVLFSYIINIYTRVNTCLYNIF